MGSGSAVSSPAGSGAETRPPTRFLTVLTPENTSMASVVKYLNTEVFENGFKHSLKFGDLNGI